MFLLGFAKNIIERKATEALSQRTPEVPGPDLGKTYPGTAVEPAVVRRLIDDSFLYLSSEQRREIFDSFNRALLDPKNTAIRGALIEHFAQRALAVRAAQIRLSQLSYREKEMMADEFRRATEGLPPADLAQLRQVIGDGLLPVPADLNQLLFAVIEARPSVDVAAPEKAAPAVPTTSAPPVRRQPEPTTLAPAPGTPGG